MSDLQERRQKERYYGETSRSPHQRGNEHKRDIAQGVATHPLVAHFREEHDGVTQEILLRVLSWHMTPLDRQVTESLNILRAAKYPEECLNLKSEWGGVKTTRPPSPETKRNRKRCRNYPRKDP